MLRVLREKCCRSNEIEKRKKRVESYAIGIGLCATYIRFQVELMKTLQDSILCAQPFTRYSPFGTCWHAFVATFLSGMYYKK